MLTAVGDVMRRCYDKGWITTRDGNVSLRKKGSKYIWITPSGVRKNKIEVESIIKMRLENGELVIPEKTKPSGELHMHFLLQRFASKTRAILHVHPTHVIAAMYAGWDLQKIAEQFPELSRYTKVGPNVPVLPVTSEILGSTTYTAMTQLSVSSKPEDNLIYDIVGQDRHGVCAIADNPWAAYEHVERLDHVCEIVLKSGIKP